ncbi:MAG: hypothetical protein M1823_002474 [Watsoniomyces obsoletus]|nr:MAG: hypothetical protein M1823_002474 [Watsoniomyces obsoletus]
MTSRFVTRFAVGAKNINVNIAETLPDRGFYRLVDAIPEEVKMDIAMKAENAFKGALMVPDDIKNRTTTLNITSMNHESPADPVQHSTLQCLDGQGKTVATVHVASDPAQQKPMPAFARKD